MQQTCIWCTAVPATPTAILEDFCDFPLSLPLPIKNSEQHYLCKLSYSVELGKIDLVNPLHMKDASILLHAHYREKICLFCEV